jgi:glycosyltransferase involved in cell wall biosynthesis
MKKAVWMVLKDDTFYVDMAIESVINYTSGIFILDTGSNYETLDIIASLIAKYPNKIQFEQKDFGANKAFRFGNSYDEAGARNYALYSAIEEFSPDWIIQLDSDEVYNPRFFKLIDLIGGDTFAHATDLPTHPYFISQNPSDIYRWNSVPLFDPHVRSWNAKLRVKWETREGAHVIPRLPIIPDYLDTPHRVITVEHVHFHLHRAFGPKCIATYLTNFEHAYEGASVALDIPIEKIFDQKYFMERYPDWFDQDGKFKPKKKVLSKLKKVSIPLESALSLPEYVLEKWNKWGNWGNW